MNDSYMGMKKNIYDLLYTNKQGKKESSYEMSLLEDQDIPWDRIEKLKGLLQPVSSIKNILIPLESAKLLSSWGIEEGLNYLENLVDNRVDKLGLISPHRLFSYDQIYEEIQDAITNYYARHADRSTEEGINAAKRIKPILLKIIKLFEVLPFELTCLFDIEEFLDRNSYEIPLKKCFKILVMKKERKKAKDLEKLLLKWDPNFSLN
ncbi:MAG TPA: hypothetical protein ENJ51_08395 [Leucothrix mucor]|uniref:Uncharacterized protein n=1 Tax=Leucothrix mucor TaxID=45248 RepID=A0A7V2T179_LEUMU|nr:hypothetical protein [Leucothrix mucor]